MLKFTLLFLLSFVLSVPALSQTSSKELFGKIQKSSKGAFGLNYLQGTRGRGSIRDGGRYRGSLLFQAAFRNKHAEELAQTHEFYTGNLFTTNYYELMGEFVYGDRGGSFALDHEALQSKGDPAMARASKMMSHWVLEKYYITKEPDSGLARGFAKRGIAGSEFEQEYAVYFFNFYLSALQDPYQYLPAFLVAKQSPIANSNSLATARELVTTTYDYFANRFGVSDRRVQELYKIRNAIHNQVSERVIVMIDSYLNENPWYEAGGNTYLQRIRGLLSDYYNLNPDQIAELAKEADLQELVDAAKLISKNGVNDGNLMGLSEALAYYRSEIGNDSVILRPKKAQTLAVLVSASQYVNKEMTRRGKLDSREKAITLLNSIYVEGFLITENWQYFREELASADISALPTQISDIIDVASMTLEEALQKPLAQWIEVTRDGEMTQFIDDTLKGSALNSASVMANK